MRSDVDGKLDCSSQVQRDDILCIKILSQLLCATRTCSFDSPDAAAERLEFLLDHFPIHRFLRSRSIRSWSGTKSARSTRLRYIRLAHASVEPSTIFPCRMI